MTIKSSPYSGGIITTVIRSIRWRPPLPKEQEVKWTPPHIVRTPGVPGAKSFFRPRTELGKKLWEIRMRGIAAGERLLGIEEIEQEIQDRRGERDNV